MKPVTKIILSVIVALMFLIALLIDEKVIQIGGTDFRLQIPERDNEKTTVLSVHITPYSD